MPTELDLLTAQWQKRPGASIESIREREASLGFRFPGDYVAFMVASNGAFGDSDWAVIEIDPIEEMAPNDQPLDGVPGVFRFGGDGAEETFAFDIRRALAAVDILEGKSRDLHWKRRKLKGIHPAAG
jgi:hypothetical protein